MYCLYYQAIDRMTYRAFCDTLYNNLYYSFIHNVCVK